MSDQNSIQIIQTAKDTEDRLTKKASVPFVTSSSERCRAEIQIDPTKTYQTIEGFGGAFTEAAAYTLSRMPQEKREEAIRAYFDPTDGLGYTLCRTHINSCDFSLENYAYNDTPGDVNLEQFDISRDKRLLIPLIRDAAAIRGEGIRILASPWSPPAWMKTNGQMNRGGALKRELYATWALYFAKYIQAYAAEGVPIWAVSVQNEPEATPPWDSCNWTAEEERDFVRDHLGPMLEKQGLGHVKIVVWDHNKKKIFERAEPILSDPQAAKYVWAVGFHWYTGDQFENLAKVHDHFPETKLLFTEGCQEGGVHLDDWKVAERYGHDMIGDLNNWTVGFIDWNMVLDETGGPNHVKNMCDAPIIANTVTGELHYEPSFYYLGHFSKYVRPGAVRIGCQSIGSELEATAFRNTDGSIVVEVMNRSNKSIEFNLKADEQEAQIISPPHSLQSLIYRE